MSSRVISIIKKLLLILLISSCINFIRVGRQFLLEEEANGLTDINLVEIEQLLNDDSSVELANNQAQGYLMKMYDDKADINWRPIVENKLFNSQIESEAKKTVKEEIVDEPKKQELTISLLAISKAGDEAKAILFNSLDNKSYILSQGEKIDDYMIEKIKKDKLILATEKEEIELSF